MLSHEHARRRCMRAHACSFAHPHPSRCRTSVSRRLAHPCTRAASPTLDNTRGQINFYPRRYPYPRVPVWLPIPACSCMRGGPTRPRSSGPTRQVSASAPGQKVFRASPKFPHSELSLVVVPLLCKYVFICSTPQFFPRVYRAKEGPLWRKRLINELYCLLLSLRSVCSGNINPKVSRVFMFLPISGGD